jgi:outer membrane murein-binding lipoprotein Lpp
MTRAQKEQYVIELYKQDKTSREIAERTHMSFRDIRVITDKVKAEVEREARHTDEEEIDDNERKSKESQAFKLFSEGKKPVEVVIALDLPADHVQAIYQEYWDLKGMYKLNVLYEEAKDSLPSILKLHKIVKEQDMGENEVINVLKLANNNELPYLQDKVEYLRNEINNLELQKDKCTNHVLTLSARIDQLSETVNVYESSLSEKREETAFLNQEQKRLDNHVTNNNGNKNEEDGEIFYVTGSWQFPEKLE